MVLASSLGLLSSREFVRDLAWFAEQLVMTDMTPQFFDDADKLCAACRERPAFFAPDKVGADASEAAVAATRAAWAAHLRERYTPLLTVAPTVSPKSTMPPGSAQSSVSLR